MTATDLVAPLLALTEAGIPADIQELLVHGDPKRSIPPGALASAIATRATDFGSFAHRFEAFAVEAQASKDAAMDKIRPLLAEIDRIVDSLRAQGVNVRLELPLGVNTRACDLRIKSSLGVDLK